MNGWRSLAITLAANVGVCHFACAQPVSAQVALCFEPGPTSCTDVIVSQIRAATVRVRVQAYYLTSPPILHEIAQAKRRGLDVAVILDKSQDRRTSERSRYSGATYLANAGIPVWIDDAVSIAHNKVIVLDGATVITGSFNFTKAAEQRNAENLLVLTSPELAAAYERNWEERRVASRPFEVE